ncbi:MAG: class I tRNA ligase family protein, partial [Candidatus Paceibacteria bacterium]
MKRVPYGVDVWYDSGAMPFSQWHWPFENKEKIEKGIHFPADYICEGIDQTRGWFYTLLAVSTLLKKGPAYLNVISLGLILDEKGEKMSKSKGNVVNPWEVIAKYGTDPLRWYFFTINPPDEPKRFSEKGIKIASQDITLLLNVLNFWKTYLPDKQQLVISYHPKLNLLDRWILALLSKTIIEVTRALDAYDVRTAALSIRNFVDDLSRWYVRRSRQRFQKPKSDKDLKFASGVLAYILVNLSKLIAPFTPFVAELVWQELTSRLGKKEYEESVHLTSWPKPEKVISDKTLLQDMVEIRKIASLTLSLRAQAGIKVRQPLSALYIEKTPKTSKLSRLFWVLRDEVNVKKIILAKKLKEQPDLITGTQDGIHIALDIKITQKLKEEGILREVVRYIQETRQELKLHPRDFIYLKIFAD